MLKRKTMAVLAGLSITGMVLAACTPTTPETLVVTQVVKETSVVKETQIVVATPMPEPTKTSEPKVMVVCMAQEPSDLYTLADTALVKSAVLEAVYDWGVDNRTYEYQPVSIVKLPNFDDGDAIKQEVEVKVGDNVYDAVTDEVVTIGATTTVNLNQMDGSIAEVTFGDATKTAKTVQLVVSWTMVDGMTWEDGTPVTTADILFAWSVLGSPDTAFSKYTYERTASYEAKDDKAWTWTSLPGYTTGTYYVDALITPLPSHLYGEGGSRPLTPAQMLEDEEVLRAPLSFGPFKIEKWVAGEQIELSKNPTYFRASEGLPKLDTLIYRFVPDTNSLIAQLASGECDLGTQDAAFEGSLPLIEQFGTQGILKAQVVAGTVYEHIDFNIMPVESYAGFAGSVKNADGTPIFANPEIRQAIAYCIDRQAVVDTTTNGAAIVQNVYIPAEHPLYAGDENLSIFAFDPAKGLALLEKNGWKDTDADGILDDGKGVKFAFVHGTRTNALRQKVTQVVQAQLAKNCMIETTISLQGGEFFGNGPEGPVFGRQYDIGEFAWLTGSEPSCNLYSTAQIPVEGNWGGQNNTGFSNTDFDAACAAAQGALDPETKAAEHAKAQKIFSENVPSLILFARAKILVTGPNVEGVIMDPTANSELWNVENFDLTTGN